MPSELNAFRQDADFAPTQNLRLGEKETRFCFPFTQKSG